MSDYGYANIRYAAQTMLRSHGSGLDVGDLAVVTDINGVDDQPFDPRAVEGHRMYVPDAVATREVAAVPNGVDPGQIIDLAAALAVGVVSGFAAGKAAKDQAAQDAALQQQQADVDALKDQVEEKQGLTPVHIIGGIAVVGLLGVLAIRMSKRSR